jgi:hypothetical protein
MTANFTNITFFKHLVIVLVLLVIADGLISQFLVVSNIGSESNLLLRDIIRENYFLLLKIAGALLVSVMLWDIFRRHPNIASFVATLCVLIYTGIVYWNIGVLLLSSW